MKGRQVTARGAMGNTSSDNAMKGKQKAIPKRSANEEALWTVATETGALATAHASDWPL